MKITCHACGAEFDLLDPGHLCTTRTDSHGAVRVKLVGPAHGSDTRASERVRLVQLDVFAEEDEGP